MKLGVDYNMRLIQVRVLDLILTQNKQLMFSRFIQFSCIGTTDGRIVKLIFPI